MFVAVCFWEARTLTKIQTEKKRAASRVGFVNVVLGASTPSESHSPWGSRGLYERWLTVKEALSLFMWIKAKFSVPLKLKPCCFSSSLTSFFLHHCISPMYLFNLNSRGFHLFLCAQMFQPALNSIVRHISYTKPMRRVRANHSAWHVMQLQWTNETVITKIMRNMQYRPVTLGLVICEHDSPCAEFPL